MACSCGKATGLPPAQGLYDPANEHDACGVGFVVHVKGRRTHAIVEQALMALAFAEGYAVLNTAGTKTLTHAVTCSGFRRAKQFSGSKMYVKAAR